MRFSSFVTTGRRLAEGLPAGEAVVVLRGIAGHFPAGRALARRAERQALR